MTLLYDPPSGWKYGFPKPYLPLPNEKLDATLLRDGYPQSEINYWNKSSIKGVPCRFLGSSEEIDANLNKLKNL